LAPGFIENCRSITVWGKERDCWFGGHTGNIDDWEEAKWPLKNMMGPKYWSIFKTGSLWKWCGVLFHNRGGVCLPSNPKLTPSPLCRIKARPGCSVAGLTSER
jgi:hypothetical protein